jgi:hypothetical protein
MGLMNRATAMVIGDEIGEFMHVGFENDEMADGRFLQVKIRLDIRKPLGQGITIDLGEDVEGRWCTISYEFLP